ncbi:MAG: SMC-Scp complex subunit ScpB [Pseudomonadota bacterium]|uniref:SMC-Scp complex subunit ScpB n=1 Tax=Halomonas sp. IOP_31 TaxID=2876584 RepID=UPI001E29174A|nr:SMC-Scp complex subunit ScpB [Halomonas sp. IOP_31]MEA3251631.1 SMC-Scp complex subunit ScpB [Pseudomonadota bacterium]
MNREASGITLSTRLDEILEAALLAAGEPLSLERIEALFDEHERPARRDLRDSLSELGARLESTALELIESASGYQVRIRQRLSPWVSRLWDERPQRYSRALLETLALIAYRQPVTRGDIEEVRGVAVSGSIMRTLSERGWIRVVGQRDVPGRPSVFATTRQFLDDFGLKTLDALPPMHELQGIDLGEPGYTDPESRDDAEMADAPETTTSETSAAPVPQEETTRDDRAGHDATDDMPRFTPLETTTPAGTADDTHAGKASRRPGLSFADLEARLAERARQQRSADDADDGVDDGDSGGADHSTDETPSDS